MSKDLRAALRAEATALSQIKDPAKTVIAVGDVFAALDIELERLASVRVTAVRKMSADGLSYRQIAELTGLTKARVQQVIHDPRI